MDLLREFIDVFRLELRRTRLDRKRNELAPGSMDLGKLTRYIPK